ncbi:MAG: GyrI-like domain-containing protein [Chitinophagaceae bacterium]
MNPRIELIRAKAVVGKRITMRFSDYKTGELWRSFMPERKKITNFLNSDLISMAIYKPNFFDSYDPNNKFEKWACVEVNDFKQIPDGLETYSIPGGLYAVFHYKGLNTDNSIFDYIFRTWLPSSSYTLDSRPHFELLGALYKNNDPESEEDIYIPIMAKD